MFICVNPWRKFASERRYYTAAPKNLSAIRSDNAMIVSGGLALSALGKMELSAM